MVKKKSCGTLMHYPLCIELLKMCNIEKKMYQNSYLFVLSFLFKMVRRAVLSNPKKFILYDLKAHFSKCQC